jgi:hypothetical protein
MENAYYWGEGRKDAERQYCTVVPSGSVLGRRVWSFS